MPAALPVFAPAISSPAARAVLGLRDANAPFVGFLGAGTAACTRAQVIHQGLHGALAQQYTLSAIPK